jgi:hypothetical protein
MLITVSLQLATRNFGKYLVALGTNLFFLETHLGVFGASPRSFGWHLGGPRSQPLSLCDAPPTLGESLAGGALLGRGLHQRQQKFFYHVQVKSLMGVIAQKTVMRVMTMMTVMTTIMMMKISRQAETILTVVLLSASEHDSHIMYYLSVTIIIQNSNKNLFRHMDNFICNVVPQCYNI